MSRDIGTRRYRNPDQHFLRAASWNPAVNHHEQFQQICYSTSTIPRPNSTPETISTGEVAKPHFPKMPSLRSIWSASTTALRQSILSRQQPFFSRSFSQLSRLSLASGLRGLRTRLQQSQDAGNGTALAGAAAAAGVRQFEQVRGMKTRSSVKRLCDGCKVCPFLRCGIYQALLLSWKDCI